MNNRYILVSLLLANLFATLLVYRGMAHLEERIDQLTAGSTPVATSDAEQTKGAVQSDRVAGTEDTTSAITDPGPDPAIEQGGIPSMQEPDDVITGEPDDIDAIKARYASQPGDAVWTTQIHQLLQNITGTSAAYVGITQDLIECKEDVCMLALGYADQQVFDAFVDDLTMALKGELAASLYFADTSTVGGNSTVDVYLVRE